MRLKGRAILFDLDGVLVDSRPVVERTWRAWALRHGIDGAGLVARAHGRRSIETVREVAPHLDVDAEVQWLSDRELSDLDGLVTVKGASALIEGLAESEWAVVTSGGRELAVRRLRHVGLPVPAVLVAAEDVREGKPAPEGYLRAAHLLEQNAAECIVVEDTPAGIQAGRSAGATVLGVGTTFRFDALAAADAVVESLATVQLRRDGGDLELFLSSEMGDHTA